MRGVRGKPAARAWTRRALGIALSWTGLVGCSGEDPLPDRGTLRQPSGLAVAPDGAVLLVTNGNWDRREPAGTLAVVDLEALDRALEQPGRGRTCRAADDGGIECDPRALIDPERTVVLGDGVGNIAVDRPAGPDGPARLLVPTSVPTAVVWLDLVGQGTSARVDCDQDDDGRCDAAHRISQSRNDPETDLPGDPGQVSVGDVTGRFAYVPHLLGGSISLLSLDGEAGPELVDVEAEFFRPDLFDEDDLIGGFAVAQRPCDPDNAPLVSRDCGRPLLYASHRYFPGLRQFTVAPGLDRVLGGREVDLQVLNIAAVQGRPFMADLAFADDEGEILLAVQTTPPGLLRVRTEVTEEGEVEETILGSVPLCQDPNALELYHPEAAEALALVACRGSAAVAVVGLSTFRVLRTVAVGAGPSEITIDPSRAVAYVANTEDDTVSIVGLDPMQPDYLAERARIGLGAAR